MRWLVITTNEDRSSESFLRDGVDTVHYFEDIKFDTNYDIVYLRDPFNTLNYSIDQLEQYLSKVHSYTQDAYFVDATSTVEGLLFEDKWVQFQNLSKFMPHTAVLNADSKTDNCIVKQRISSRARGIYFSMPDVPADELHDYVVQPRLHIMTEYRVYVVGGKVLDLGSVKSAKSETDKVKVLDVITIGDDLKQFSQSVASMLPSMDLIGLDVAKLANGQLVLIEVNRSPQFLRYNELAGVNLFDDLQQSVESNIAKNIK